MCRLAKQKSNKAYLSNLYLKTKGYFREKCKSENINHMFPTPKFTMSIIQIIVQSISTIFSV